MKNLHFFDKVIFFLNIVFALLLLFSYALPYGFLSQFPLVSVLSLMLPVFLLINFIFLLYWLLKFKKQSLLSFFILLAGYPHILSFYKFFSSPTPEKTSEDVSIMTYNVRLFNAYRWIEKESVAEDIISLIREASPDILCIQEFYLEQENAFTRYPYRYIENKSPTQKNGQAIFSRFPIINKGSLAFPRTSNSAVYVDVVKGKDTVRIYNLHLESLRIHPGEEPLTQENSGRMFKRMATAFSIQQSQVEIFEAHARKCPYKKIVCGDFNNTQYSHIYRRIKKDRKDSFTEAGKGFGRTFNFGYFPVRIDFILADETIEILAHKNYTEKYSDHFPVLALLRF